MYTVAIVEDSSVQRDTITRIVTAQLGHEIHVLSCATARECLAAGAVEPPDIALLDVELPDLDGIALAQKLHGLRPSCRVIFLTSHGEYAPDAYNAPHIWFITKTRMNELLPRALTLAVEQLTQIAPARLCITQRGTSVFISQEDVLYLEHMGRTSYVVCRDGSTYQTTASLDELMRQLDSRRFARCHASFIVNLLAITQFERTELRVEGGAVLPISRSHYPLLRNSFADVTASPAPLPQLAEKERL